MAENIIKPIVEAGGLTPLTALPLFKLAATFGLLTGLGEVLCLGVRKFAFQQVIFFGPSVVWLAPLADVCLFVLLATLLLALAQRWPRATKPLNVLRGFSFLLWLSWLLNFPRLQPHAVLLLALGATFQTSRWLSTRRCFKDACQATLPNKLRTRYQPLALTSGRWIVLLLALSLSLWSVWRAVRVPSDESGNPTTQPNVLLLVLDTVRARNLSLYGYTRATTPRLAQFAQRSIVFERAVATAPWTLPAHASMFTGRWAHELAADWEKPLEQTTPTLAERLRAHGYQTAGFVANTYYCGYEFGLQRGFEHYDDYPPSFAEGVVSSALLRTLTHQPWLRSWLGNQQVLTRQTAADVNRAFLHWQTQQRGRPFFAFLNYLDAHEPYYSPLGPRFGAQRPSPRWPHGQRLRSAWREQLERLPPAENQAAMDAYDGALAYLDEQLGQLLDELEQRGVLQQTLVIITADHGEAFGEHSHYAHGDNVYWPALHVPLLLSFPARLPLNQRLASPVSLRDLPATVFDVLGLEAATFPGTTLARYWQGAEVIAQPLFSSVNLAPIQPKQYPAGTRAELHSLIFGTHHYLRQPDGREELYDYVNDPAELNNLGQDVAAQPLLNQLRQQLQTALKQEPH